MTRCDQGLLRADGDARRVRRHGLFEPGAKGPDNIRKFIRYLLSCNIGEILVMLLGTLLGWPLPLLPLQMLLVNLVTDGLPALALGLDPPGGDVMSRPPRDPRESLFARGLGRLIAMRGVIIGLCTLAVFAAELRATGNLAQARTVGMCTLVLSQLLHAFDARSETRSIWQLGLSTNPALLAATASSLAVLLAVLYTPALAALFRAVPLGPLAWLSIVGASSAGAVVAGLGTLLRARLRRRLRRHPPARAA